MRKHDVRKWLHAVLDLLPVILIPVFMIYSHRHDISGSEVVSQKEIFYQSNVVENVNDLYIDNVYYWNDNIAPGSIPQPSQTFRIYCDVSVFENQYPGLFPDSNPDSIALYLDTNGSVYYVLYETDKPNLYMNLNGIRTYFVIISFTNKELIPNEFLEHIGYCDLQVSKGLQYITYSDTDIMSQMMYQLYNAVDKYFNMGNVFNMTGVYQWFVRNIFNGYAPMSIYIVWNIVLYEFVMDLLFLLYGLFMWFIDMVEKLMEKPLKSVK